MVEFLKNIFKSNRKPLQGSADSDPAAVYAVTSDTGRKNTAPGAEEKNVSSSSGEEGTDNSGDDTFGGDEGFDFD